jgi:ankyrin repeat protein
MTAYLPRTTIAMLSIALAAPCVPAQFDGKVDPKTSPILAAAEKGDLDLIKKLVDGGANVNLQTPHRAPFIGGINRYYNGGQTPLLLATAEGHVAVAKYLLEKGARADVIDQWGYTPLTHSSRQGHVELVKLMLKQGVKVPPKKQELPVGHLLNGAPAFVGTPLHMACEGGHDAVVAALFEAKFDVNAKDGMQRTPLHRLLDDLDHVALLRTRFSMSGQTTGATKVKKDSAKWKEPGRAKALAMLIEAKADVSAQDREKQTPLGLARRFAKDTKLPEMLEKAGARLSAADAIRLNDAATLEARLKEEPKLIEERLWHNRSLFLLAVEVGHQPMVELLIRYKADQLGKNDADRFMSPLRVAVEHKHPHLVRLFIDKADKIEFKADRCIFYTAFEMALTDPSRIGVLIEILRRRDDISDDRFLWALYGATYRTGEQNLNHDLITVLLAHKGKADMKCENVVMAVENAVRRRDEKLVALFIKHGAGVDRKQKDGHPTALTQAASNGDVEILKLLLKAKPNLEATDSTKRTALHYSVYSSKLEVVRLLVEAGASVFARDQQNQTPGMAASREDIRAYLREMEIKQKK